MSLGANKNLIKGAKVRVEASSGLGIVKADCAVVLDGESRTEFRRIGNEK